jgi:hypothetical protein
MGPVIAEASARLIAAARELDETSKALVQTENAIELVEPEYEDAIEGYVAALWEECVEQEKKFPPLDVRNALAVKAMPTELRRNYRGLLRRRQKAKQRLTDLRELVAAQRSIVSAAKTEVEATEGPQPAWTGAT